MTDPVKGISEMARVTKPGGVVAACVWDLAGGRAPISPFWQAVHTLDGDVEDESRFSGARQGHLVELFGEARLRDVEESELAASSSYESFDEWWRPYTLGVGPAGKYLASLSEEEQEALRDRCREVLPEAPFDQTAHAWAARGVV